MINLGFDARRRTTGADGGNVARASFIGRLSRESERPVLGYHRGALQLNRDTAH